MVPDFVTRLSAPVFLVMSVIQHVGYQPGVGHPAVAGTGSPVLSALGGTRHCSRCVTAHVIEDAAVQI